MRYRVIDTPAGEFALLRRPGGGVEASWTTNDPRLAGAVRDDELLSDLCIRLRRYFDGEAVEFEDVATPAGPVFHRKCWAACRRIPRGEVWTYGELASRAGADAGSARAAGQAMRRNPLPVIVPCHRVVRTDGDLHGYSGSLDPAGQELGVKRYLLGIEGREDLTR